MELSDINKGSLFRMCGEKDYATVGFEFGLDKKYKTVATMKSTVRRIYNTVKNDPQKYGISEKDAFEVALKVEARQTSVLVPFEKKGVVKESSEMSLKEQREVINPQDIKSLVIGGRNKAMKLMNDKLHRIGKSVKLLDAVSLGEMAKVVGILVDKSQILQGQSTENIAILSKNVGELTAEEALAHVLKMREANVAEKE